MHSVCRSVDKSGVGKFFGNNIFCFLITALNKKAAQYTGPVHRNLIEPSSVPASPTVIPGQQRRATSQLLSATGIIFTAYS